MRHLFTAALVVLGVLLPAVAHAQSETVEYYGTDVIGSIRIVWDASGNVVGRQDYAPFGKPLFPVPQLPKEGFGGQETDGETDQAYFHARMFQARTGRFTKPDPIRAGLFDPQRWNAYSYALNAPMTTTDPTGMNADPCAENTICRTYTFASCEAKVDGQCLTGSTGSSSISAELWAFFAGLGWTGSTGFTGGGSSGGGGGSNTGGTGDNGNTGGNNGGGADTPTPTPNPNPRPNPNPDPPNPPTTERCYSRWKFSSYFASNSAAHTVAQFIEIGAPVSLIADLEAATVKATTRPGMLGTSNVWASGLNRALRAVLPTAWRGTATAVGDVISVGAAVAGAGTASFNITTWIECATGVLR